MTYAAIAALVLLGAVAVFLLASWRRSEKALFAERVRADTYRRSLASTASIATGARNVRCPTCLANWSSVLANCEAGLVGGDSARAMTEGTAPGAPRT
jgi:hypothetical protein